MDAITLPGTTLDLVGRLLLATLCGALVGANRERQRKPAGLRTHALVSLGASIFTVVGLMFGPDDPSATGRVIQGITAGIGFIGAGVIMRRPEINDVQGLTTAAGIWVVAALGVGIGCGLWWMSVAGVALTVIVLTIGEAVDRRLHAGDRPDEH